MLRPTYEAEQQAAPKAAPGEPSDVEIDDFLDSPACITWVIASNRDRYRLLARAVLAKWAAPQPAPAPLSEMPYEKRKAIQEGEQIGASDAWFKARHEMLDTVDRRNVFRAGFDRGWNAALAAQGGKDA